MSRRIITSTIIIVFLAIVVIPSVSIFLLYKNQKQLTQHALDTLNQGFVGELKVGDSRISPFSNFPYVSIDLLQVVFYGEKNPDADVILNIKDLYIGFSIWDILKGKYNIKSLKIEDGLVDLTKDLKGNFNLIQAIGSNSVNSENVENELEFNLSQIQLQSIKITYNDLSDLSALQIDLSKGLASINFINDHIIVDLDSDMVFDYLIGGKPSFFFNKHLGVEIQLDYDEFKSEVSIPRSRLVLEDAYLTLSGKAILGEETYLDLEIGGEKPDFSLLAAFLPNETGAALKKYKNEGDVYFQGSVKGIVGDGIVPEIAFEFGCDNAYFLNPDKSRKVDELRFSGFFTNGKDRSLKTSEFQLLNFYAKPEQGKFQGKLVIRDFEDPYVKVNLNADLDLEFLGQFFEVEGLEGFSGQVIVNMDFDELIALDSSTTGLTGIKNSLESELIVKNLNFKLQEYPLPVKNANVYAFMKNGNLKLENLAFRIGDSDFKISGSLDDFPALIHGQNKPVRAELKAFSNTIDLNQLIPSDTSFKEVISDFSIFLAFESKGFDLLNFEHLPKGEFFIEDFHAKLKNYPHAFHDFHADIIIDEKMMEVMDFSGEIDKSDFHFSGKVMNYPKWFQEVTQGDSRFEFDLVSNHLNISDLLSYNGVNYLPKDYQNEEIDKLSLKGSLDLHYDGQFQSADFYLKDLDGKFKVHPLRLHDFRGRVHYENDYLTLEDFGGNMGESDFSLKMGYFLGESDSLNSKANYFFIKSKALDLDKLMAFEGIEVDTNHQEAFNVFELPFTNMAFEAKIGKMNYHNFWLEDVQAKARTTKNHYIHLDTLGLRAAEGTLAVKGYFNGSDPSHIYFHSTMKADKLDLDKLLFKFENFGQDYLINENLHGKVSGTITSKFLVYPDLTPIIDKSEADMDLTVYQGSLVNFAPLSAMSSYFSDKNLNNVRFDTLKNTFELKEGILSIPRMNINSSLGFIELSGKQSLDMNMDYFIRIPLGLVTSVGFKSLFAGKNKDEIDPDQEDSIVYRDGNRRVRFVNVNMKGTPDDYKVSLAKDKNLK
ncbi:AsmA-like C-terminal region-containing protein [Aquiflexum sp. TKW24L]|uniref:AsmA-like C-terminal region-containing protein n=1 Tax=Aquiflexum sp. TKW24L TaxID=2942212 RepID=UPI0020BF072A|nr:AsmA-like C-terminal region-containing protein [Aquiflexum sp. TKW24L]MCL6257550.1 AsmA-like C-terminal region-containing protein [Aquiflexum sp. TKW24L]